MYKFGLHTTVVILLVSTVGASQLLANWRYDAFTKVRTTIFDGNTALLLSRIEEDRDFYMGQLNLNYHGNSPSLKVAHAVTCSHDNGNTAERLIECIISQAAEKNVLVLGDSIGRDSWHALRRAYPDHNFLMLHQSSCPPGNRSGCFTHFQKTLDALETQVDISAYIINFRYTPTDWQTVEHGIEVLKETGNNIILMGVSPMFSRTIPDHLKSLPENTRTPLFIDKKDLNLTQWDYRSLANDARSMAARHNIKFVDLVPFFCPQSQCRLWVNDLIGKPLFFDQQHLTDKGISEFSLYLKNNEVLRSVLR